MDKSFLKAAKSAFLHPLQIGFESANKDLKNAFFGFVESVLNVLALKVAVDDKRNRKINNYAQLLSFMDVGACRALTSTDFVCPVAVSIREKLKE